MKKKVALVTCYFKKNYGSVLQAYATQKFLDLNNIENETINIENLSDFSNGKRKYYFSQIFNFNFLKSKFGMIKFLCIKKFNKKIKYNLSLRNKKFDDFLKKFHFSEKFETYNELNDFSSDNYSNIIVGSDQLWLPVNVVSDYYTLNWVPETVNKISYATSFGISSIPNKYKKQYFEFLNKINYISVREKNAVDIVKNVSKKESVLVCDPTLLLTKEDWLNIQPNERLINEKYIFCYFLGSNIEHRKFVERLKEKTGFKIVSLNHCDEYVKYSDKYADYIPYNVGPSEFINYIRNAEYVCTDSFHATVFSIINNIEFFTFSRFSNNEKMSTNSRIYSLLDFLELKNRLIRGNEEVDNLTKYSINYEDVNKKIIDFSSKSKKWFLNSIFDMDKNNNISLRKKEDCCGCNACLNICPKNAISMKRDQEGFLYPSIDRKKCINCGLCKKVCPILNRKEPEKFKQTAFIFQNTNEKIRSESTSGGAFSAIAEYIIKRNGVVFGVGFDEKFYVKHQYSENISDLKKFRNSKYVQSDTGNTYLQVKNFLEIGRLVCYSGTSCQISGLKNFLKKDYDNLILVDVVCRAVPSPLLWEKYLKTKNIEKKDIEKIYFRDKFFGYKYSNLSIYTNNKNDYHSGVESDPYLRAFFSNILDRPSCYNCKFKTQYRESDITLWDCFNVEVFDSKFDDDKGTTRVLVHTKKGLDILNELSIDNIVEEVDVDKALSDYNGIFSIISKNKNRANFVNDLNFLSENELFKKYFPDTFKIKAERFLRLSLIKTKYYKRIITLCKKIRRRK